VGTLARAGPMSVLYDFLVYGVHKDRAGNWVRRCPTCGRDLRKPSLWEPLKCVCGWIWG
jgi:hypothetical protein